MKDCDCEECRDERIYEGVAPEELEVERQKLWKKRARPKTKV